MSALPSAETSWTCVLFSGSRMATPAMLDYTRAMVKKAIAKKYWIFVGDNPEGVDMEVLKYTEAQMYPHITIWSPKDESGQFGLARSMYKLRGLTYPKKFTREDYYHRDQAMADFAQKGIFIWNGHPKNSPGTIALYNYMTKQLDKEAHLINFQSGKPEVTSFTPLIA